MDITVKPLSGELLADYLYFFDNIAFTDNGPVFPTSPSPNLGPGEPGHVGLGLGDVACPPVTIAIRALAEKQCYLM